MGTHPIFESDFDSNRGIALGNRVMRNLPRFGPVDENHAVFRDRSMFDFPEGTKKCSPDLQSPRKNGRQQCVASLFLELKWLFSGFPSLFNGSDLLFSAPPFMRSVCSLSCLNYISQQHRTFSLTKK